MKVKSLSRVGLFATPWTVTYQAPRSMGFSRQEYWSGLPFPSPGDLPNPGIEPGSPALQTDALPSEPLGKLEPIPNSSLISLYSQSHSNMFARARAHTHTHTHRLSWTIARASLGVSGDLGLSSITPVKCKSTFHHSRVPTALKVKPKLFRVEVSHSSRPLPT